MVLTLPLDFSDYVEEIGELPVWCHGQGIRSHWFCTAQMTHGLTWTAIADGWHLSFSKVVCEDFPSWPAEDIQEICRRAEPNILSSLCICPMHPSLHVSVGTYCCDSQNGKACGDAVHPKAVLIYAPLFCNHKAWSNTMPTKSALFASLYEYNLRQIFSSCNLPETSNLEGKLR